MSAPGKASVRHGVGSTCTCGSHSAQPRRALPNGFLLDIFRGLAAHNAGTQRDPDVAMTGLNDVLKISVARLRYAGHIDVYRSNIHESSIVFPVNEPRRLLFCGGCAVCTFQQCNLQHWTVRECWQISGEKLQNPSKGDFGDWCYRWRCRTSHNLGGI